MGCLKEKTVTKWISDKRLHLAGIQVRIMECRLTGAGISAEARPESS